eukprot:scaffold109423_cov63-Phaeocystis_antarctica.AAC.3
MGAWWWCEGPQAIYIEVISLVNAINVRAVLRRGGNPRSTPVAGKPYSPNPNLHVCSSRFMVLARVVLSRSLSGVRSTGRDFPTKMPRAPIEFLTHPATKGCELIEAPAGSLSRARQPARRARDARADLANAGLLVCNARVDRGARRVGDDECRVKQHRHAGEVERGHLQLCPQPGARVRAPRLCRVRQGLRRGAAHESHQRWGARHRRCAKAEGLRDSRVAQIAAGVGWAIALEPHRRGHRRRGRDVPRAAGAADAHAEVDTVATHGGGVGAVRQA